MTYWMPFNGGIGLHDANWRSSFGGSIYQTNGSHGCVNLPRSAAKEIYERVYDGIPIICYY
ncbi:MAG: L,D-transpeptidase [Lachnospiraceae bacterium]